MRILLVEDDLKIASFIKKGLKEAGFAVDHVTDGEQGLDMALTEPYDAAIVDIMLPKKDGTALIEELRRENVNTPVIILSARRSLADRVRAIMRRASGAAEPTSLTVGDLSMNLLSREVTRAGERIDLQPREFALLSYLMRNAGVVVSKTMIMEHVWDYNFDPQTNVVEVRISRLRDKIDRGFTNKLIHTIRGAGYVLREDA
ncbi:MAG: response regulator [Deltaproteobacteria bacterium]|nr:response regulator [Deltaproteobacteria bacterium]NIS77877.1 response regulator [Deltaproteobacteria bacterium]